MKTKIALPLLVLLSVGAVSCASNSAKLVDQELATEAPVKDRQQLKTKIGQLIENTPDLSGSQKKELYALREKTDQKITSANEESLKLRSLLINRIISQADNSDEVNELKGRIYDVEKKRIQAIFDAINECNHILGKMTTNRNQFMMNFSHE